MTRHFALIPFLAALAACGNPDSRGSAVVRDSAGIQIVENTAPAAGTPWHLAPEPVVSIGVEEGDEAYQFSDVGNAFRLADGRIVVANRRNPSNIRVYDESGRHLRTLGRSGSGPGEFVTIFFADHIGDTIRAYDPGAGRITRFAADGELIDVEQLTNVDGNPAARFILFPGASNGGLLGRSNAPRVDSTTSGPRRGYSEIILADASGTARSGPMRIADGEYDEGTNGLLLFAPRTATTVADSLLYVGTGASFSIDVYGPDLALRRIIRRTFEPRQVGNAESAAYVEERLAAVRDPARRSLMQQSYAGRPARAQMPAHDATIVVDSERNVWVRGFQAPGDTTVAWSVFDPTGVYLSDVTVPLSLQILDIEDQHVLAIHRGELDVQRVQLLRLVK